MLNRGLIVTNLYKNIFSKRFANDINQLRFQKKDFSLTIEKIELNLNNKNGIIKKLKNI